MNSSICFSSSNDISDVQTVEHGGVTFRDLYIEETERRRIEKYLQNGCSCTLGPLDSLGNKTPCFNWFDYKYMSSRRDRCLKMSSISRLNHEAYVYGHFAVLGWKDQKIKFKIRGRRVCLTTFSFLMAMGQTRVRGLYAHYFKNGFTHKLHKLTGNPSNNPYNRNINKRIESIKHFLENLMKDNGIFVAGSESKAIRFSSHWNRKVVYDKYKESCLGQGDDKCCCINTFIRHWKTLYPELSILGSQSDEIINHNLIDHDYSHKLPSLISKSMVQNPYNDLGEDIPSTLPDDLFEDSTSHFDSISDLLTHFDAEQGLSHASEPNELKSHGKGKKRCFSCKACDLHAKYLKKEIRKCGNCKHCRKKYLKKACIKFICKEYNL